MGTTATKVKRKTTRSKLTLSVSRRHVDLLRRLSKREGKSITELVEEFAESNAKATAITKEGDGWVKRNAGILAKKVKPADWKRDDRVGELLRKSGLR
ncbi:MAG: DUF6364 family protein [Flavobacteriales bacterium]|jgi:hypothetical protein|nr:hypothetical protein [Flavobacteriales bacterium]MBP9161518.1 hypothetical protein [Flavobacteriales bacterium]MCI1753887.1 DUF6364 family protein [Flavobacteriales bacterium]